MSGDNDDGIEINEENITVDSDKLKKGSLTLDHGEKLYKVVPSPMYLNRPFCSRCGHTSKLSARLLYNRESGLHQPTYFCRTCGSLQKLTISDSFQQWLWTAEIERMQKADLIFDDAGPRDTLGEEEDDRCRRLLREAARTNEYLDSDDE